MLRIEIPRSEISAMRKMRRLNVEEPENFTVLAPSAAPLLNKSSNSSLISSSPNNIRNGSASLDNPHMFRPPFSASMALLLVALLLIVFFTGFFSIYLRRFAVEEEPSRRRGAQNERMRYRASQGLQGLDRTVIETLPLFKYSLLKGLKQGKQALECVVCLSEFEDGETLRLLPKCGHMFHPDCIDMWLFSHNTCPLCRTKLVPEQPNDLVAQQRAEHIIVVGGENNSFDDNGRTRPGQVMGYNVQRSLPPPQNQSQIISPSYSENLSLVGLGVNPLTPF